MKPQKMFLEQLICQKYNMRIASLSVICYTALAPYYLCNILETDSL